MVPNNYSYGDYLYRQYYGQRMPVDHHASSYWRYHSSRFKVEYREGQILSVWGSGLGAYEMESTSRVNKLLARLTILFHLMVDSRRANKRPLMRSGRELAEEMGLCFTNCCFSQVYSLALIVTTMRKLGIGARPRVMIIGDGYGFLACLIKKVFADASIVLVDLGKTLLFQHYHVTRLFPEASFHGVRDADRGLPDSVRDEADFIFCPADSLRSLETLEVDVAVNICSMQEMTYESIADYFALLRSILQKNGFFYCCNRERKELLGGEIIEFENYPWSDKDDILLDGRCHWLDYRLSLTKRRVAGRKLAIMIPWIQRYMPHRHRIAMLARGL